MRYTLCARARAVQEIKKSKIVAFAANMASPESALSILAEFSDPGATHNCWAWRIGSQYRFSDDGEPAGTAGKPILQAIDGREMDRIIVVVTRRFGGIKLGAGGLMRAYGGCAAECLRNAARQPIVEMVNLEFALAFSELPLLTARLSEFDAQKIAETFDSDGACLRLRVAAAKVDALRTLLGNLSRGRCEVRILD